jgi:hypothetical protein
MNKMKIIMENFRKTMKEAWPGTEEPKAPWTGKPNHDWSAEIERKKMFDAKETIKRNVAAAVRDEILADFENKYANVSDIVDNPGETLDTGELKRKIRRYLGDEVAASGGPAAASFSEDDYNHIVDLINTFGEDNEEDLESDVRDNPGYSVGQGASWK